VISLNHRPNIGRRTSDRKLVREAIDGLARTRVEKGLAIGLHLVMERVATELQRNESPLRTEDMKKN
jgi:hypothetical protein